MISEINILRIKKVIIGHSLLVLILVPNDSSLEQIYMNVKLTYYDSTGFYDTLLRLYLKQLHDDMYIEIDINCLYNSTCAIDIWKYFGNNRTYLTNRVCIIGRYSVAYNSDRYIWYLYQIIIGILWRLQKYCKNIIILYCLLSKIILSRYTLVYY